MSFENKGSTVATIIVARDGTGNFNCSGVNDQVDIGNALTHASTLGITDIRFKSGTYDINNLTISTDVTITAKEGDVIWTLPATPSLTISAKTVFEGITFYSVFDGTDHIVILDDVKFEKCFFNFQLDTLVESRTVMVNSVANNRIEIIDCRLVGGRTDIDYFGLLRTTIGMDELIIRDFFIESLVSYTETGKLVLINLAEGDIFKYVLLENIEIHGFDWRNKGGVFLSTGPTTELPHLKVDGFTFFGGTWVAAGVYFAPFSGHMDYMQVDDMTLLERWHPVIMAKRLEVNNFIGIGDGDMAEWDCGSAGSTDKIATFTNCYFENSGLTINTGWKNLDLSNCRFESSRLAILDEGDPTGAEKNIQISNCQWNQLSDGKYNYCILVGYDQGVKLTKLQITNVLFTGNTQVSALYCSGVSAYPTHFILVNVVLMPVINVNYPQLFGGNARNSDDHVIWIFDSEITTKEPPLRFWNPIRPNDRFDNVKWIDTADSGISYSENEGVATIPLGAATVNVTHDLVVTPTWVLLTGGDAEVTQLYATALGAATFTATTAIGVTSADRSIYWRASVTR